MRRTAPNVTLTGIGGPLIALCLVALCLAGCNASPAQNMFGSFFPAWMLCAAAGIFGAISLRLILSTLGISRYLIAPPLTWLSVAVTGTLLVWLFWFGH
ncbi:MAG TPA: YtcA family lipoprotein [Acetobacteraceae bacterium]|nr:YtcA family lipoprotein [Acetobacteraceae bacterium]